MLVRIASLGLVAGILLTVGCATSRICVNPGEKVTIPLPIANEDELGESGGDSITSMKVVVVGPEAFVSNVEESATYSIPPGESRTFRPSFIVPSSAKNRQKFDVLLKIQTQDTGLDPAPGSPGSDTPVKFIISDKKCRDK